METEKKLEMVLRRSQGIILFLVTKLCEISIKKENLIVGSEKYNSLQATQKKHQEKRDKSAIRNSFFSVQQKFSSSVVL